MNFFKVFQPKQTMLFVLHSFSLSSRLWGNVPRLRFPGFEDGYRTITLGKIASVVKRTDSKSTAPIMMLSAGNSFIMQSDKYSRDNAGQSLKKYTLLKKGEMAYNHGSSKVKQFGCCYELCEEEARVPYVYHCFKVNEKEYASYIALSLNNPKIDKQLKRLVSSSVRMDGLLNISFDDYMSVKLSLPSLSEQKHITSFIEMLEERIVAQKQLVETLKKYKRGLLSTIFPEKGKTIPRYRFSGFIEPWEQRKVSDVAEIIAGGTPSTKIESYWKPKEIPWLSSGEVHKKYITFTDDMISKEGMNNSSAKMVKDNSVLIALAGQGKTRGIVAINRISLTTNQSIAAMTFNENIVPEFVFCNLENRYDEIRKMSSGDGARGGLNKQLVGDIEIPYTAKTEQKIIGSFFTNLNYLITLHQYKLNISKKIKSGLLQQGFF